MKQKESANDLLKVPQIFCQLNKSEKEGGRGKRTHLRFQPPEDSLSSTSLCRRSGWTIRNLPKKVLCPSFTKTRAVRGIAK
jgi:hypothetical protein